MVIYPLSFDCRTTRFLAGRLNPHAAHMGLSFFCSSSVTDYRILYSQTIQNMWSPFGEIDANGTVSWKSGPNERGTLNILTTCLITLTLCVYSTIHLNIPEHGKTGWIYLTKRKAVWACVGLLAPEVVCV